jgi:eukaryotic-like serine/threonine-protein kinase
LIGSTLDKYEVLQKVGEGGMATVYRGRHTTLGRDVAIKVLHPHLSSSTRNRKRFAREARAIEHLRHDNILEIFDYSGADAEDCYIVTEFVGGRTLTSLMEEQGRLPGELATIIGVALARALAYAHGSGVLHRDLKPDNVMVRYDGTVKLMDFGIARFLDESQVTMTGALVGSPAFMSPEQAREKELDGRSDLFSLGTLLFYLASGHLPFAGSNPSIILKNIIEGNRAELGELTPSISASLVDVVERLLQTDREDRFNRAADVEEHLLLALAEVRVDPTEPRWTLAAWFEDPDAYARRLDEHLKSALMTEGRRLLQAGDALAALRLLNRLLAIDEDNAEVLALVQGLHAEPRRSRPRGLALAAGMMAAGLTALGLLGLLAGSWWPDPDPPTLREPVFDPAKAAVAVTPPAPTTEAPVVLAPRTQPEPTVEPRDPAARADSPARVVSEPTDRSASAGRDPRPSTLAPRPAAVAPAVVVPPAEGCLEVRPRNGVAYLWLDGEPTDRKTNAPGCMPVSPGTHTVLLTGTPYFEDLTLSVTVAPGEVKKVDPKLVYRPIRVVFPDSFADDCALSADDRDLGTLATLGRTVDLERAPGRRHALTLVCGADEHRASIAADVGLEVAFAPRGRP